MLIDLGLGHLYNLGQQTVYEVILGQKCNCVKPRVMMDLGYRILQCEAHALHDGPA